MNEPWRIALLPHSANLRDGISCLDKSGMQIALVVNSLDILIGTVTDGDIRRGLLRGLDMNSPINVVMFKTPLVVPPELPRETVLQIMQANKVLQLPVVNSDRKVMGLHLWDDLMLPKIITNMMVIMAGGKGTRLKPYTENCPKPMLPINGKPMLEHIIERAKASGFNHFVLAIHYLGNMVEEHFGDGSKWHVKIEYLRETTPMGTAGAIGLLNPIPKESFLVTNGDVLTDIHYGEFLDYHKRHSAVATMAVRLHEWEHPFGVVVTKGVDIVGFEEKPISRSHINAGIYVLDPQALNFLNKNEPCDMPTLFSRISKDERRTIVYPMHEPWLDVGRPDDLEQVRREHQKK
jgi:dTDP-glucose pyrophosphorylase